LEKFDALSFKGTEHSIWKERVAKCLDTHKEVVLPEGVSFETLMLNVEKQSKLALVLSVSDEVFQ